MIEEKIMAQFSVEPLAGVGYEGMFGTFTTLLIMPIMYYFVGSTPAGKGGFFDIPTGLSQLFGSPA